MKNILLVFAKLNQGIRYVQGMNEILAPIFYVFRNDPDEDSSVSRPSLFATFFKLLWQDRVRMLYHRITN